MDCHKSYNLTSIISGYPYIISLLKDIIVLDSIKIFPDTLYNNLGFIFAEVVIGNGTDTSISDEESWFFISLYLIVGYLEIVVSEKQYSIFCIVTYDVILDCLYTSDWNNTVMVILDLVIFYDEFLAVDGEDTLWAGFSYVVTEDEVVEVVGALEDEVGFERVLYLVFLEKYGGVFQNEDTVT